MDPKIYQTYMPHYTGHIPKIQREEVIHKIEYTKHIPGNYLIIIQKVIWVTYKVLNQKINTENHLEKLLINHCMGKSQKDLMSSHMIDILQR